MRAFATSLFCLALAGTAHAQPRPQVAVLDFEVVNVDPLVGQALTEAAATGLRDLRVFRVTSASEIRQMLAVEKDKSLLSGACEDNCISQVGNAIGARYLVKGSVSATERRGAMLVRLKLFDMRRAEVVGQEERPNLANPKEALEIVAKAAQAVVRPILDKEQGFLEIACRENGANVTIDGRLVGVTPFAMQKLGWGPHRVVIEKEGFIAWAKDVQVERNQATTETVSLIPSPEFIDSYRSKHRGLRAGAWITTVLAVLAAGAAVGIQYGVVEPTFDKFKPYQDAFAKNDMTYCTTQDFSDPEACWAEANSLSSKGNSWQWGARGAAAGAVVATGLAAFFWAAGEDPGRYDAYRGVGSPEPEKAPRVTFLPTQGGGMATFGFSF